MVLLTMTPAIVEALAKLPNGTISNSPSSPSQPNEEPALSHPLPGNPISHKQVLSISHQLKTQGHTPYHLEHLLHNSQVYTAPPPPPPEPSPEYKALMAHLRREAESRAYRRMLEPSSGHEAKTSQLGADSAAHAFAAMAAYAPSAAEEEVLYKDVKRQVTLIFNVLISVFACGVAIWVAARWWDTPARLALSMSGSVLVGVAEVVVYSGYLRRVGEAKAVEGKVMEVKEVVRSWAVGGEDGHMDGAGEKGNGREVVDGGGDSHGKVKSVGKEREGIRERKRRKEITKIAPNIT